jgi:hypothetical protein
LWRCKLFISATNWWHQGGRMIWVCPLKLPDGPALGRTKSSYLICQKQNEVSRCSMHTHAETEPKHTTKQSSSG